MQREEGVSEQSVLPKMSVGALSCHLGRPLDSADAHYNLAAWVTSTTPDDSANERSTDDVEAALGATALDHRASKALDSTRETLATGAARDVVLIPWQGWSLRRDDFLLTGLLEIVVHTDDLALSIDVLPPTFPDDAFTPVLELLTAAGSSFGQAGD